MKNVFVVTLGTREVQFLKEDLKNAGFTIEKAEHGGSFLKHVSLLERIPVFENENYPDYIFPSQPRTAGEIILNHIDLFWEVISFPLISKSFETIKNNGVIINEVIVVFTNQQDLDSSQKKFWLKDTVNYKELLFKFLWKNALISHECKLSEIAINKKATDIDFQYGDFAIKCKSLFENIDNISQIFLLPQGGIDQINHALTLQLIQAFGNKVKLWQQAEASEPKVLEFPFMFIRDLNKQKILKHLSDYDFGLIASSGIVNDEIKCLSEFAYRKLNLDYDGVKLIPRNFKLDDKSEERAKDLYLNAKIYHKKEDYAGLLWRIFTLMENIYRIKVDRLMGDTAIYFLPDVNKENTEWLNKLKSVPGLFEYLSKIKLGNKRVPLKMNNPNRMLYKYIYNYFKEFDKASFELICDDKLKDNAIEKAFNIAEQLSHKRNGLAHYLKPISIEILEDSIGTGSILKLIAKLDEFFDITSEKPYGIYDDIRKEIEKLL